MTKYGTTIKDLIRSTKNNSDDYDEEYMKMEFNSDDNLLAKKKKLELYDVVTAVRFVFNDGNKYYPQVFLDECLYKLAW